MAHIDLNAGLIDRNMSQWCRKMLAVQSISPPFIQTLTLRPFTRHSCDGLLVLIAIHLSQPVFQVQERLTQQSETRIILQVNFHHKKAPGLS